MIRRSTSARAVHPFGLHGPWRAPDLPMTFSKQLQSTTTLLDAAKAVGNWRALALSALTVLLSLLVFGLFASSGLAPVAFIGFLGGLAVLFYGLNAVGIMLMDDCRLGQVPSLRSAVRRALTSSHRVLAVALIALGGMLALVALVALLLVLCKIPLLGPLLFAAVLPLSTVLLGAAALALFYVYVPLTACAIWTGASVMQAVSVLLTVVRRRLLTVILQEFVLTLIVVVVSFVVGAVLMMGLSITASLSAAILGPQALSINPAGLMMGYAGSSHLLAAIVGGTLLAALAAIVPGLILIQGFCRIYLEASDSLAGELPTRTGDDVLNTAARLRAAEETAQAQQREHEAAQTASHAIDPASGAPSPDRPAGARIEPTIGDVPAAAPLPADSAATASGDPAQPPAPASPPTQQNLGFSSDEPPRKEG